MLQIESTFTSQLGTQSSYQAQLLAWCDDDHTTPATFVEMGTGPELRRAITLCTPFAVTRTDAPELAGVLLRLETEKLRLVSTDGRSAAVQELHLQMSAALSDAGLFDARALSWIADVLPKESEVALSLRRGAHQCTLLISVPELMVFCQALPLDLPIWERVLQYPVEEELHLKRQDLVRALKGFTASSIPLSDVSFSIEERMLLLDQVPSADENEIVQSHVLLSLLQPAGRFSLEVNPAQLKRLANKTTGELIRLQVGTFLFGPEGTGKKMGFVRLPCGQMTLLKAIAAPSPHPSSNSAPRQEAIAVQS